MKELDLLLERWFELRFAAAGATRQHAFQQLLDEPDPRIAGWLIGGIRPADPELRALVDEIVCVRH
ncbi:MAG: succinate dehydrogenase assembly factor 2 [Pseudomonadota bacterium]|nr:succinate dehydrogenase assembly factor 2 [Pseudomonadota bacterium]